MTAFGTGIGGAGTYTVSTSQKVGSSGTPSTLTITNTSIPWGMQPSSGSANMSAANAFNTTTSGNPGSPWAAVVTDNTTSVIPSGTGNWPWWGTGTTVSTTTPGTPGSATLSAGPTGTGIKGGDQIYSAPLYQLTNFVNDYRVSDTSTTLNSASDIVAATNTNCLGTPGGLGTYYADAINAAQTAVAAASAARVAAGQAAGQNVIIILSDGAASSSSTQMGPLLTANQNSQCHAAITAAQNAAKAGTWVYAVYYDDGSTTCNDTATVNPPSWSKGSNGTSCAAMQDIANTPTTASPYYAPDFDQDSIPPTAHRPAANQVIPTRL